MKKAFHTMNLSIAFGIIELTIFILLYYRENRIINGAELFAFLVWYLFILICQKSRSFIFECSVKISEITLKKHARIMFATVFFVHAALSVLAFVGSLSFGIIESIVFGFLATAKMAFLVLTYLLLFRQTG